MAGRIVLPTTRVRCLHEERCEIERIHFPVEASEMELLVPAPSAQTSRWYSRSSLARRRVRIAPPS